LFFLICRYLFLRALAFSCFLMLSRFILVSSSVLSSLSLSCWFSVSDNWRKAVNCRENGAKLSFCFVSWFFWIKLGWRANYFAIVK
jgi:hypothetical protein